MDFGLSEEQRLIVETTRAFVENELYPQRRKWSARRPAQGTGGELKQKSIAAGLYAANMPEDVGGAGLDTVTWLLYEKELGRANYALHCPASAVRRTSCSPGPTRRRKNTSIPAFAAKSRLPRHDRAGRRIRSARHEGDGRREGRRLGHQRHQALHQPCRHADFVILFAATRRGRHAARQEEEDHRLPGRHGHTRIRRCAPDTRTSPTAATTTASSSSTIAGCPRRQSSARCTRGSTSPTHGSVPHVCRSRPLSRPGRPGAATPRMGGAARAVRPADRQVPGRLVQARRHGNRTEGRRAADLRGRRGSSIRAPPPTWTWPWPR